MISWQTMLQHSESIIVGGGLDKRGDPIKDVEYLNLREAFSWKTLGQLQLPRFGSPTIGRVQGISRS